MVDNGHQMSLLAEDQPIHTRAILVSGKSMWSGMIREEYLSDLKPWTKAMKVYRQMMDDAVLGVLIDAISAPLLAADFAVEPGDSSSEARKAADMFKDHMNNMEEPWSEHVLDAIECLPYGFSISEMIFKKNDDGTIGIRTLMPVGQETLYKWGDVDQFGHVMRFYQRDPVTGAIRDAPMDKLLHFTIKGRKRNPEGQPLFRSLYRPWYFKNNLEVLEAIGAERDVGNAPVATPDVGYTRSGDMEDLKKSLEGFRMDEALFMIMPPGVKLQAYGGGNKVYDIRTMIRDWQHLIRQRFFADFVSLGTESTGSQALAKEAQTFFSISLEFIQRRMTDVWNRRLITMWHGFNAGESVPQPKLVWRRPGRSNVQALAQFVHSMVNSKIITPDDDLEDYFRDIANLPAATGKGKEERTVRERGAGALQPESDEKGPPKEPVPGEGRD